MTKQRQRRPRSTPTLPLLGIPFDHIRHPRPPYDWLDPDALERIHLASLDILENIGIDYEQKWREFEAEVAKIKAGEKEFMTWDDAK